MLFEKNSFELSVN